jgi:uncharacterized protein YndB with AHSA1/START domain
MSHLHKHRGRAIRDSIRIAAPPDLVWSAWTDPGKIVHFFPDQADGAPEAGSHVRWGWKDFEIEFRYTVREAAPNHRWVLEGSGPSRENDVLEIAVAPDGAGGTVVTLVNSGFLEDAAWDEEFEGVVSGWHGVLAMLKLYVEKHYGRPRTQFSAVRTARYEYSDVFRLAATTDGLGRWLGHATQSNGVWSVALASGRRLTGRPVVTTKTEIFYEFDEIQGTLAINAFGSGPESRLACLLVSSWLPETEARAWHPEWAAAFDRFLASIPTPSA